MKRISAASLHIGSQEEHRGIVVSRRGMPRLYVENLSIGQFGDVAELRLYVEILAAQECNIPFEAAKHKVPHAR
jgi:hypothetical protein